MCENVQFMTFRSVLLKKHAARGRHMKPLITKKVNFEDLFINSIDAFLQFSITDHPNFRFICIYLKESFHCGAI